MFTREVVIPEERHPAEREIRIAQSQFLAARDVWSLRDRSLDRFCIELELLDQLVRAEASR